MTYDYYSNGIVKSVTDALGKKATYSYDTMNRLKTVSQAVTLNGATQNAQVGYTYTNDRLTQIAHNGFNYGLKEDLREELKNSDNMEQLLRCLPESKRSCSDFEKNCYYIMFKKKIEQ